MDAKVGAPHFITRSGGRRKGNFRVPCHLHTILMGRLVTRIEWFLLAI